jgi:thiamine-monophosphate kinase
LETALVDWLLGRIPSDPRLEVPPGDDAAVLRPPAGRRTVVAVDMLTEGVDFILGADCSPRQVGHKALAVNLSDLAAMAARPEAVVVAVALPREGGEAIGRELWEGLAPLAAAHGMTVAGGDTNSWDGPLVVSVTVIGSTLPGRAWRRDAARPGDLIVATGRFGGSLAGRHLAVVPRVAEALAIADRYPVHAAIDVSDGLSLDLARMMAASGTAALLDLDAIPIHADAVTMAEADAATGGLATSPLERALGDGEDFELLLTMPPDAARAAVAATESLAGTPSLALPQAPLLLTIIGEVVEGQGLFAREKLGGRRPLEPRGWVHGI